MDCFLGIDLGTSGVKAAILTDDGALVGRGYVRNQLLSPAPGMAEADTEAWWRNACSAIRQAVDCSGVDPRQIRAAAVSGAGGIVPVDRQGAALGGAVMQMDRRALRQFAQLVRAMSPNACRLAANRPTDGVSAAPFLRWFLEEAAPVYKAAHKFLAPNSYLTLRLTRATTADLSRSGATLLLDPRRGQWSKELIQVCGIDADKLPLVFPDGEIVGTVTAEAAAITGLPQGLPVAAGAMDTAAAGLGCGALESGQAYVVLGTFGKFCALTTGQSFDLDFTNVPYSKQGLFLSFAPTDGGAGLAVDWLKGLTGLDYAALNDAGSSVPPCCGGLSYLPWMTGARGKRQDPAARASLVGLDRTHGPGHLFRAVLEGVAYSAKESMDALEGTMGMCFKSVSLCGGGSESALWTHIFADVLNKPIRVISRLDAEAVGAAILACRAVRGVWLVPQAARQARTVWPDPVNRGLYREGFETWKTLGDTLGDRIFQHR